MYKWHSIGVPPYGGVSEDILNLDAKHTGKNNTTDPQYPQIQPALNDKKNFQKTKTFMF